MADSKITALASIGTGTDPANDPLVIVDVSDILPGGMSLTGTTKKVTLNNLLACSPTAGGNFTITGDLTVNTQIRLATNATYLYGKTSGGSATRLLGINSANDVYVGSVDSAFSNLRINSGGTDLAILSASGNLGLGVTPSAWRSTDKAIQINTYTAISSNTAGDTQLFNNAYINSGGAAIYLNNNFASRYEQYQGEHAWYTAPSGTAGNTISGVNAFVKKMTLNTNGCLALQGGNTSATGVGIAFPATQAASSDANTLDDYEEGTWTGTLKGSVSDPTTPVTATGRYTKVGRQVFIDIPFSNVNTTGASGSITVTGLPFTCNGSVNAVGTVSLNGAGTYTGAPLVFLSLSTTTLILSANVSGAPNNDITHNAGAAKYMNISISYTV